VCYYVPDKFLVFNHIDGKVVLTLLSLKKREDIPTEYTWDLSTIFARDEDWEQGFQSIQNRLPELEALKGTLAQSGQALLKVLQKRDEIAEAPLIVPIREWQIAPRSFLSILPP